MPSILISVIVLPIAASCIGDPRASVCQSSLQYSATTYSSYLNETLSPTESLSVTDCCFYSITSDSHSACICSYVDTAIKNCQFYCINSTSYRQGVTLTPYVYINGQVANITSSTFTSCKGNNDCLIRIDGKGTSSGAISSSSFYGMTLLNAGATALFRMNVTYATFSYNNATRSYATREGVGLLHFTFEDSSASFNNLMSNEYDIVTVICSNSTFYAWNFVNETSASGRIMFALNGALSFDSWVFEVNQSSPLNFSGVSSGSHLDLINCSFDASLPSFDRISFVQCSSNDNIRSTYDVGFPAISVCHPTSSTGNDNSKTIIIIVLVSCSVLVIVVLASVIFICYRKTKKLKQEKDEMLHLGQIIDADFG